MKSNRNSRSFFSWFKWIILIALAVGGWFGWQWYSQRMADQALDYKTVPVGRGDITQVVTANGVISPLTNVAVGSQVSGIITDIKVDFNAQVTNNQVIAQIDPSTYQQNIIQSQADVANAKAGYENARLNFRRAKELFNSHLISQSDYEKADVDMQQAEAVLKMRDASLNKAKVDLERTTIYAPINGLVISRNIDVGQTVAASFNTPTLFQIANDLRQMRIEAMVSEADIGGVKESQKVNFLVDAFPGRPFSGVVKQVRYNPITNQNVVNYVTVVSVNNDDLRLRPGMTANASIVTSQRDNVIRIPNAALRFRPPEATGGKGATNAPAARGNTNIVSTPGSPVGAVARAATAPDGMPTPPWRAENRQPSREERQKWMESLTPEQREQMMQRMQRMRGPGGEGSPFGGGGGGGMGGGFGFNRSSSSANQEGPMTRTVYILDKDAPPDKKNTTLKAVTIKTGITDGAYTEVLEGLKEGDVIVTGLNQSLTAAGARQQGTTSPFGGPFGGGMRPR